MATTSSSLNLSFMDDDKATRTLKVPNSKADLDREQVLPVMSQIVADKVILSKNKKPLTALKSAKISTVKDLEILEVVPSEEG